MNFEIFKFKSVSSTNDIAMDLIKKKRKKVGYVYAETQTKGRGTHGKKWISLKGNLFGSIFFPLKNNYPPFNEFSLINAIIISDVIKYFCKDKNINFKFPNDVLVNKKKICGLLQEVVTSNDVKFLIVGMGINVISNPHLKEKYQATNIFIETKNKPPMKKILKRIVNSYEKFFTNLSSYKYENYKKQVEQMVLN